MTDSHFQEIIEGKIVEINPTPEHRYDYGGFGWVLRMTGDTSEKMLFSIIIDCNTYEDERTKQQVLEMGRRLVSTFITQPPPDSKDRYCYVWTADQDLSEIDCTQRPHDWQ